MAKKLTRKQFRTKLFKRVSKLSIHFEKHMEKDFKDYLEKLIKESKLTFTEAETKHLLSKFDWSFFLAPTFQSLIHKRLNKK